jgi:hypothetical protein
MLPLRKLNLPCEIHHGMTGSACYQWASCSCWQNLGSGCAASAHFVSSLCSSFQPNPAHPSMARSAAVHNLRTACTLQSVLTALSAVAAAAGAG